MYCNNCGKQIGEGKRFCRYCGAPQVVVNGGTAGGAAAAPYPGSPAARPAPYPPAPQPAPQPPAPQPAAYPPAPAAQPPVAPPQSAPVPLSQPAATGSAFLASQACSYKVAMESEFKKFEFGGMPEGTVDIYEDRLEFFLKSKMVRMAFGAIGSALSGKGKPDITIYGHMVRRETVTNQKNAFRFYLTDGRLTMIYLGGLSSKDAQDAMRRFLRM